MQNSLYPINEIDLPIPSKFVIVFGFLDFFDFLKSFGPPKCLHIDFLNIFGFVENSKTAVLKCFLNFL